ncbi:MAG: type IV secretion system protein [Capnocytophaga sp.]|nr:type IV secretion system protein [Capnocytophaga sp.]
MNTKYITILCCIGAILFPFIMWGDTVTPEHAKNLLAYTKGDGSLESWFMEAFANISTQIEGRAREASILGRTIAGFGALIHFGIIGFRMQNGEAEWSIEPMLKPIIIGLILINWVPFVRMVQYPFMLLATPSESVFKEIEKEADALRTLRYTKQMQVLDATIKLNAELNAKQEGFWSKVGDGKIGEAIGDQVDKLTAPMIEVVDRLNYKLQKLIGEAFELGALAFLRIAVYFTFFIQKVWAYVLIVLGPIAVGMALIPGFESSFYNWLAKFININLYTFVAYTIINIGQQIIMGGYQMDINRLSLIVDANGKLINEALLLNYTTANGFLNSVIFPVVGYFVTGIGVLMTPSIADAVVQAGGAGIMTKAKGNAGKVAGGIVAGGKGAISGGKSIINAGGRVGRAMNNAIGNAMSRSLTGILNSNLRK